MAQTGDATKLIRHTSFAASPTMVWSIVLHHGYLLHAVDEEVKDSCLMV